MDNREVIKAIQDLIGLHSAIDTALPNRFGSKYVTALSQVLTLLKEYQSIKGGVVPSEDDIARIVCNNLMDEKFRDKPAKEALEEYSTEYIRYTRNTADIIAEAIRHQVKLGIVKFKERLPSILREFIPHSASYCIDDLAKAISTELGGGKGHRQ